MAVRVIRKEAEGAVGRTERRHQLMLFIEAARLILQIVGGGFHNRRRRILASLRRRSRKDGGRAQIVREVLVYALRIDVGDVAGHGLRELPVDADRGFHIVGRVHIGRDVVEGGRILARSASRRTRGDGGRLVGIESDARRLDELLLVRPVFVDGLNHVGNVGAESVGDGETLIEPSVSRADDGFGLLLATGAAESIGHGDARRPVVFVVDPVLRLPANAVAEGEALIHLPVILVEERTVEEHSARHGIVDVGVAVLARCAARSGRILQTPDERGQVGKDIGAIAAAGGGIHVVVSAQSRSEVERVRTFRAGEIILQLEVVLVILYGLRVAASVGERLLDGVGRQTGNRILTVANAPVLQANVVDQILAEDQAVGNLDGVVLGVAVDRR